MNDPIIPADVSNLPGHVCLNTEQAAAVLGRRPQTLRRLLCQQGHACGVRPARVGGRLLWRVADLRKAIGADIGGTK